MKYSTKDWCQFFIRRSDICLRVIANFALLIFILSVSLISVGQTCENFKVEMLNTSEQLIITKFVKIEKRSDLNQLREVLKKELQLEMSSFIGTVVSENTKHNILETNGRFSEFFNSQIKIETSTKLGYAIIDFCEDKENKVLWGSYKLNRKDLAVATVKTCNTQLAALNSEILGKTYSDNKIDIQPIQQRYLNILNDHSSAIYLDYNVDVENWEDLLETFNIKMGQLSNSQDQLVFNSDFNSAKDQIKLGNFLEGIKILKRLKVDYYNNDELNQTLNNALEEYKNYVLQNTALLLEHGEFHKSLEIISKYCSIQITDYEINERKVEISKQYFYSEIDNFRKAIKFEEAEKVNFHKKNIDSLSEVNLSEYAKISEEYNDYKRKIGMKKAIAEKNKKNYWESYRYIQELEIKYGKRDNELMSLKKNVKRHILKDSFLNEKKSRQLTWSFWVGSDLIFNNITLDSVSSYMLSNYTFSYSGGLYRKYRFEKKYNKKSYPVRSDFIGIKTRLIDYQSSKLLNKYDSLNSPISTNKKVGFEIGIDGISWRVLHYNLGVSVNEQFDFKNIQYYSATIGFRLPLGVFSWTNDIQIQTKLAGEGVLLFSSGIQIRFDFNRKFGRADKRKITAELFG